MTAGREMDALVAEKVMGIPLTWVDGEAWTALHPCAPSSDIRLGHRPKAYSEDIAAAWEVVEHLLASYGTEIRLVRYLADRGWSAEFIALSGEPSFHVGETAPHAICLAALKAVGVEAVA